MKTGKKNHKLSRTRAHRDAMLGNLARQLIIHEEITTTLDKSRALRPFMEKLVTVAIKAGREAVKPETRLAHIRRIDAVLRSRILTNKLVEQIAPRFQDIKGGYLRIVKLWQRQGDAATISLVQFVK